MGSARPETTGCKLPGRSRQSQIESGAAHALPAAERLVYTVPEAGRLLGLSRNGSYEAAKRGDIPTLRIGRLLMVPKAPFHRLLEPTATGTAVPAKDGVSKRSQSYNVETAAGEEEGPET